MCFFMWLVTKDAILTCVNLQKRGWVGPNYCVLCKRDSKDGQHLLLNYPYSTLVWLKSASTFGLDIKMSERERILARIQYNKRNYRLATIVTIATCWNIWKERNERIWMVVC